MIVGIALLFIAAWCAVGLAVSMTFGRAAGRGAPAGPFRTSVRIKPRRREIYDWSQED